MFTEITLDEMLEKIGWKCQCKVELPINANLLSLLHLADPSIKEAFKLKSLCDNKEIFGYVCESILNYIGHNSLKERGEIEMWSFGGSKGQVITVSLEGAKWPFQKIVDIVKTKGRYTSTNSLERGLGMERMNKDEDFVFWYDNEGARTLIMYPHKDSELVKNSGF